jgi:Glycosyl hydrolase family 26/F5/8 type C domain
MKHVIVIMMVFVFCSPAFAEFETEGLISIGKFYTYDTSPSNSYSDSLSCLTYSDGAELTDETMGASWPLTDWVAWSDQDVEITLDLGKVYSVDQIKLHTASRTAWSIHFPDSLEIYYRESTGDSWTQYGSSVTIGSDTSDWSTDWLVGSGGTVTARYIKFDVDCQAGEMVFLDQLEVYGTIKNTWKQVPSWGCLHGGYHVDSLNNKRYQDFEIRSGKTLAMILAYLDMETGNDFSDIEDIWENDTAGSGMDTDRLLSVGWLPDNYSSDDIASGDLDSYFDDWFSDANNSTHLNTKTIWLRPMNEMNTTWTSWGGDPSTYRQAWRRMYNIAEQIGVAEKLIFQWSPNYRSFPDEAWNKMDEYYPGDQYVDWVGLSLYPPTVSPWYPNELIDEIYTLYGDYKPMIISEGAFNTESPNIDCVDWTYDWFDVIKNDYPMIKAAIWENHMDRRIESSPETTAAYRYGVEAPYFLPSPEFWQEDFKGINGNIVSSSLWEGTQDSTDDTAWKAADDYNDGLPSAYVGLLSSGNSDLYCSIPMESGSNYAIGGNLVDYLEASKERSGGVKVWFESEIDTSDDDIIRDGWCVYLTRVHTNPSSWYLSIGIKDPAGNTVASKYLGSPGSKKIVPFVFRRNNDHIEIQLDDLIYNDSENYNADNKYIRLYYYVSGSATAASPLLGVTGLTMSSEWAQRDAFYAIDGPLAETKWKPTSNCSVPEIWKACTSYTNYSNQPAAYAGNCYSGVSELYSSIPLNGDYYKLTGNLLDFVTAPVDRGSTLRFYIESDVNDSTGQVSREGWTLEIYRIYTNPASWYDGYKIKRPNGSQVAAQYVGSPGSTYVVPFSFERNGSNLSMQLGNLSHTESEAFDTDNKEIRLYYAVAGSDGPDHTFFGISDLKLLNWEEDFDGVDALLTTDSNWKETSTSATNKWYGDSDYDSGSPCAYAGGIYTGNESSDVYTTIPISEHYKLTGDLIDFDTTCDTTGLVQVRIESDVNTSTDQIIRSGWRFELKREYTSSNEWEDRVRVFNPSNSVVIDFYTEKDQDYPSGTYKMPFVFERNGSEVILKIGGQVYVGYEEYDSDNNQMILSHYKAYNVGGDSTYFGVSGLEMTTWTEAFDSYDGNIYKENIWKPTANRNNKTNYYSGFMARNYYDDGNPYLAASGACKIVELGDPEDEFAELYTLVPEAASDVYTVCGTLIDYGQPVQQQESTMTVYIESAVDGSDDVTRDGWQIAFCRYYSAYASNWIITVKVINPAGTTVKEQYVQNASSSTLKIPFKFTRNDNNVEIWFRYGVGNEYSYDTTEAYSSSNNVVSMLYEVEYEQGEETYTQMGLSDFRILYTP